MTIQPQTIAISRTDSLGDVVLTLPIAGLIKKKFPNCKIFFIGKKYTESLIRSSEFVDSFLDVDEILKEPNLLKIHQINTIIHIFPNIRLAKVAYQIGIKNRIGTSHRFFHWLYCNKLVNFSRKKSNLHESELNLKLLKPILGEINLSKSDLVPFYGLEHIVPQKEGNSIKKIIIFHPKSKGSARDWDLSNYIQLSQALDSEKYTIYITGTVAEKEILHATMPDFFQKIQAQDVMGKFDLKQFIDFIACADALVACSTGPLHIAAALGKAAIGIYPNLKPMHAGRWAPVGKNAIAISSKNDCNMCKIPSNCLCMKMILCENVAEIIKSKFN